MSNVSDIIKDAIEGGWDNHGGWNSMRESGYPDEMTFYDKGIPEIAATFKLSEFFLDPLFWQAAGKTRGWEHRDHISDDWDYFHNWMNFWHRFIDHLAEGKSYEEALSKLV